MSACTAAHPAKAYLRTIDYRRFEEGIAMRFLALFAMLAGLTTPLFANDPISVNDLAEMVAASHGKPDSVLAKQLYDLKLTERLSTARLAGLEAELPSKESRKALLALADASAFLDLPASDIPATAPLDRTAQQQLLQKSIDYVKKQIPLWPDFLATEAVIQFSDVPPKAARNGNNQPYNEKLHLVSESSATIRFLAGKEEVASEPAHGKAATPGGSHLSVQGVFGPIFSVLLKDVLVSNPTWSHWEVGTGGPMAVFRYQVPRDSSHYVVQHDEGQGLLAPFEAYHGEIGLDSETGAILRLTLIAEVRAKSPVARADILVEYGPQKLGGKSYICPVKSVAISLARELIPLEGLYSYRLSELPPFKFELNDTAYTEYHLFHSEVRVLSGDSPAESGPIAAPAHPQR